MKAMVGFFILLGLLFFPSISFADTLVAKAKMQTKGLNGFSIIDETLSLYREPGSDEWFDYFILDSVSSPACVNSIPACGAPSVMKSRRFNFLFSKSNRCGAVQYVGVAETSEDLKNPFPYAKPIWKIILEENPGENCKSSPMKFPWTLVLTNTDDDRLIRRTHLEYEAVLACPQFMCAQPPIGCHYVPDPARDANGCAVSCGLLSCDPAQ
jgi:hypothetical protein